jgi:FtsH-binding integral membrane protein
MLSAYIGRGVMTACVGRSAFNKTSLLFKPNASSFRQVTNHSRTGFVKRAPRQRTLKEIVMAPAGEGAFTAGKGFALGASALGLGGLCFYGLGLSSEPGAIERSMMWPEYVKDRIRTTYLYFGGSLVLTAGSAVACFRSPAVMNIVMKNSWMAMIGTIAIMIGTGMMARSVPYQEGIGAKQAAWALHSAVVGAVIAPLLFLGGPLLVRAALFTSGIVGGLSTVAVCAPSDKFLSMGGPLAIGLGAVFAASLGSMFLPPTTALGAGLASISLYGGLVLFSAFLLYDTQRIVRAAELHSPYSARPYDPVNASISIYMDTINIFIRIATILAQSQSGKRR